ncbi:MAG: hypothetical protein JNM56_20555, partial [Planctomycetia bacterium]|nr:hypothetical protein [Planctomycetia bacterium]
MTEQEWLGCADPRELLRFFEGKTSDRKFMLFAVACCRSIWEMLTDERSREAIHVAERYADNLADEREIANAAKLAWEAIQASQHPLTPWAARSAWAMVAHVGAAPLLARETADSVSSAVCSAVRPRKQERFREARKSRLNLQRTAELSFIRDVFGNPFRPVTAKPAWFTSTVISLATAVYDERGFDRMPILADALEDAGCDNADILNHCRQPGEHVRGCWLVDLILSK